MNKEYIHTTVLKNKTLEAIFKKTEDFMKEHRKNLKSISPAQWNALLSFCLRKNNIGQIEEYLRRKMKRRGNPWYGSSAQRIAQSLINIFETIEREGLKEAEDKTLRTLNAANQKCFEQNWISPELSSDILYNLKLQQIQTFISVLVRKIYLEREK